MIPYRISFLAIPRAQSYGFGPQWELRTREEIPALWGLPFACLPEEGSISLRFPSPVVQLFPTLLKGAADYVAARELFLVPAIHI